MSDESVYEGIPAPRKTGVYLRSLRQDLGMSQVEAAHWFGIRDTMLDAIEKNRIPGAYGGGAYWRFEELIARFENAVRARNRGEL